jgi:hypothetical protein
MCGSSHLVDKGCEYAKQYLGRSTKCAACPFGDCIGCLSGNSRIWIFEADLIKRVIDCLEFGIKVNRMPDVIPAISADRAYEISKRRNRIKRIISRFAPAEPVGAL